MPVSAMESPPNSQDVHSQVLAAILAPIRDLNENWKVDLSAHLETYLRELCDPQTGLGSVNFVEAALLIQRSVGIYGKKVEYLWQLLMQVLESFQKKRAPGEKGNERRKRTTGGLSELLQDFVDIAVNIDKKKWKEKVYPVKLEPPFYSELEYNCPREKKLSLFDHLGDPVGDKSDFRLNFAISDGFMLEEELSHVSAGVDSEPEIETEVLPENSCEPTTGDTAVPMPVDEDIAVNTADEDGVDNMEILPPEPEPEVEEHADVPERVRESVIEHQAGNMEKIATIRSKVDWTCAAGNIPDKAMNVQDRFKNAKKRNFDCDSISSLVSRSCVPAIVEPDEEEMPKFRLEIIKATKNKKKIKEQRRLEEIEEYRKTLAADFTGDFLGFEDYEPSSGEEDGFLGYPEELPDNNDADDNCEPSTEDVAAAASAAANNSGEVVADMPMPNVVIPTDTSDWTQTYQNILQEKMHSARVGSQDAQAALASRVNQWHESIRTTLQSAEERGSMDIHEYGTHILNTFPQGGGKTTVDFAQVVQGKESEEVCRYFLACLMLANTYNVQISQTDSRPLAMNCMELTLLKSTRHHEALEEYQAPSQAQANVQKKNSAKCGARSNKRKQ